MGVEIANRVTPTKNDMSSYIGKLFLILYFNKNACIIIHIGQHFIKIKMIPSL